MKRPSRVNTRDIRLRKAQMNESSTCGSGMGLEETVCPVKSFYGNSSSRVRADAPNCHLTPSFKASSPLVEAKTHLPSGHSAQVRSQSTKQLGIESVQRKASLVSADRKIKTVERKSFGRAKVKNAVPGRLKATHKELAFKMSDKGIANSEKSSKTAELDSHSQNENNSLEGEGVKRFFKNRTSHNRKFVTSMPGRLVNLADLSNRSSDSPKHCKKDELCAAKKDRKEVSDVLKKKLLQPSTNTLSQNCTVPSIAELSKVDAADQKLTSTSDEVLDHENLDYENNNNSVDKTDVLESSLAIEKTKSPSSLVVPKPGTHQTVLFSSGSWTRSHTIEGQNTNGTLAVLGDKRKSCDTLPKLSSKKDKKEQMILDFGQKLHGTVNCSTCGMTYARNHPDDELLHSQHHRHVFRTLQYNNKTNARIAQDFQDGGFVVVVTAEDRRLHKRVEDIKQIVDKELGYILETSQSAFAKTFLYVLNTQVCGFCLAQPISRGYRMQNFGDPTKTQCCSEEAVPVRCAISRIWVLASHRRKGIASRLLDVVRGHFLMGYPLSTDEIAFSDPTPDGAKLAAKYCQTAHFLVYNKTSM